jgi:hypothetical protein
MKRIFLLTVGLVSVFFAAAQTFNDPNAQVREAKNFHGVSISSAFDVYMTQGTEEAVAVSAAETQDRDRITVEVKNGILVIGFENGTWKWKGNKKLKAYVSFKSIDKINVSGACNVYIDGIVSADELKIHLSGASDLKGIVTARELTVDLSGASDLKLTGTVKELNVDATGASKFQGTDLVTDICNARATGASDIRITVNKELSARATGASDIRYKGDGVIRDIKTSGASSISRI